MVRATRRPAFHRRNLSRLVDGRVRIVASRFTVGELERVRTRIERASEAGRGFVCGWGDAGILIRGVQADAGRVVVQVIAARGDYAACCVGGFGPAVRVVRVGAGGRS